MEKTKSRPNIGSARCTSGADWHRQADAASSTWHPPGSILGLGLGEGIWRAPQSVAEHRALLHSAYTTGYTRSSGLDVIVS
jgi:hypothetical protein